jgi:hydrogenase nickel incorporation protein HypA/HybF
MHELSIAESIVTIADRHAAGRPVEAVQVRIGHLRQVVPSALEFAFTLVAQGTALDGARLDVEHVPASGVCRDCGAETTVTTFPLCCARCGGLDLEVLAGQELLVDSIELAETLTTTGGSDHGH